MLTTKGIEGIKSSPIGSGLNSPKKNWVYALQTHGE